MPRYFVTTSNGITVHDDHGIEFSDLKTLELSLRDTLATMLRDESPHDEFSAQALDDKGNHVLTMRVRLSKERD